jgi:hypothetical protein
MPAVTEGADLFGMLADECGLLDVEGLSPDGLYERYLYSPDKDFRYAFGRWWGNQSLATTTAWVGLNPATGDSEGRRRPTLDRCISWSKSWDSTGLVIVNLFGYRHTDPKVLKQAVDPVGPHNDTTLVAISNACEGTVAAWGAQGGLGDRSATVRSLLTNLDCLGTTKLGEPRHPLYVPATAARIALPPIQVPRAV